MFAGSTFAGAPFPGLDAEATTTTVVMPFLGNTATLFAPLVLTFYPTDPGNPIFDPDDPEYIPGAVPGGSSMPYGIGLEQVDLDTPTVATPIDDAYGRQWQDQLRTDGTGRASMDTTTAVKGESVLRFSLNGQKAFQALVDQIEHVVATAGEEHDQVFHLSGRGAVVLLENAAVWQTAVAPSLGLDSRPLSDVRYFNYAEVALDDLLWHQAVATFPDYDGANLFGRPKGMKDLDAQWLWGIPGGVPVPAGFNYFRQYFTYAGPSRIVRLEAAADDELELWVDGVPILEISGVYAGGMKWTTFELTPGDHLVAVRGNNRNALRAGIIWSIGTMDSRGRYLDVIAHSDAAFCQSLDYPMEPPGFTIGRAWRILYLEAQARGETGPITDSIDELVDYNGTPWATTSELSVRLDQSLLDVARMWADSYWDFMLSAATFDLIACIKGQLGSDVPVSWDLGVELTELANVGTAAPTVALVRYDGGRLEVVHPDAAGPKGRRVRALSLGAVKTEAQATAEGMAYLEDAKIREETLTLQIDIPTTALIEQVYAGARNGDSPLVDGDRDRIHGINVTEDGDEFTVTPEVISAALTDQERMYVQGLQMNPGGVTGRSRAVKPAPDVQFPSARDGSEYPWKVSWEGASGAVELIMFDVDGVTEILLTTLDPLPGAQGKYTFEPPDTPPQINELTKVVVKVGGTAVSQQDRTDEGIWIMEFVVNRDIDPSRGTAVISIAK